MTNKSNNVITFPKSNVKQVKDSKTVEDIHNNLDMMKQYHIQETILNIAPIIFNQIDVAGFGLDDQSEEDIKDGAFLIESLRSMLNRYYDIYHPFQDLSVNIFSEKPTEEGVYKIADEIHIKFKNVETEETEE